MKFDSVFLVVGEFGRYQKRICLFISFLYISFGIQTLISVFLLGIPDHRCRLSSYENDTFSASSEHHSGLLDRTIPSQLVGERQVFDQCRSLQAGTALNGTSRANISAPSKHGPYDNEALAQRYLYRDGPAAAAPSVQLVNLSAATTTTTGQPPSPYWSTCSDWVYSKDVFQSTFVSKMNLVCDQSTYRTHIVMAFMFGFLVGSLGLGTLADMIGRKKALMLAIVLHVGSNVPLVFASSVPVFVGLRALTGASCGGAVSVAFSLAMELVGPSMRVNAGMTFQYFWALGLSLLSGVAYLVRDWGHLQLAMSLPTILYLSYFWLIPESPRWLLQKGRRDEAMAILGHMAKVNRTPLSGDLFEKDELEDTDICVPIWRLFVTKTMAVRTLIIWFDWFAVYLAYLGLSLNAGSLSGDIYLNFFLLSVVEFVAYTFLIIFLNRLGRKPLYIGPICTSGAACLLTIIPVVFATRDYSWVTVALAVVGKTGAAAASATVWVYSAELFPTVVRTSAMGFCAMWGRVGGLISPYIADMSLYIRGPFAPALPLAIFGLVSLLSGVLSLWLPETMNKHLPETIEDAETQRKPRRGLSILLRRRLYQKTHSSTINCCVNVCERVYDKNVVLNTAHYYRSRRALYITKVCC